MADAQLSTVRARIEAAGGADEGRVAQTVVRTIINFPADEGQLSSLRARVGWTGGGGVEGHVSQLAARILYKTGGDQRELRAWTYSLDGHDHYVLRLGTLGTIVLDLTTGQWADWFGQGLPVWRPHVGQNWIGMAKTTADRDYGTNIVGGDDRAGILWMLDPTIGIDDASFADLPAQPYLRTVTGLVPMTMRNTQSDGGVYLTISLGQPTVTGAAITLRISDDWGKTYSDRGSITINHNDYTQEIAWRGLGLIRAPGRLYEFSDSGAAIRIGYAERK